MGDTEIKSAIIAANTCLDAPCNIDISVVNKAVTLYVDISIAITNVVMGIKHTYTQAVSFIAQMHTQLEI